MADKVCAVAASRPSHVSPRFGWVGVDRRTSAPSDGGGEVVGGWTRSGSNRLPPPCLVWIGMERSQSAAFVDPIGIEPTASAMPWRRSTK